MGPCLLTPGAAESALDSLARSIVSQQLSGKAASTIYRRFRALFPPAPFPSASDILALDPALLRSCGLSLQKTTYLRSLCQLVASGSLSLDLLASLDDEEVIASLTRARGLGRWTAQMFLMFHLGRLDIWPSNDLGVRKGLARVFGGELPTPGEAEARGEPYRPYRTIAAWYLWRAAELEG